VITDFASMTKLNCRALPSGMRLAWPVLSIRVMYGRSTAVRRRSHLTLTLPSRPGTTSRSG